MMPVADLPAWIEELLDGRTRFADDTEKMTLALELARSNVRHASGGPFGAAIFNRLDGGLISVGVNLVVAANNSVLHAEMVAIMQAETRLASYTLASEGWRHELFCSCAPCAMCLGGILWSGLERVVAAAEAEDARGIGFDEGPVFEESYRYLEQRGIEVVRGFMQPAGRAVLQEYAASGGIIYNRSAAER